jgi:hypothetical protein
MWSAKREIKELTKRMFYVEGKLQEMLEFLSTDERLNKKISKIILEDGTVVKLDGFICDSKTDISTYCPKTGRFKWILSISGYEIIKGASKK